jgi:hypothetical protein
VQIGAENRTKLIAAVVLLVVAVLLIGNYLFTSTGSQPAAATAPASTATGARAQRPAAPGKKSAAPRSLDPTLRYDWLKLSEDTKYEGRARNIFRAEAEPPQPIAPAVTETQAPQVPQGPPPPPPINLKFFGFASKPGETKKIFLSQDGDVFIASEGDIVDRRYKVLRISPMSVEIEDVLNNNRQNIPLTQG